MRIVRLSRFLFQSLCISAVLTCIVYVIGTKRLFVQILLQRLYTTNFTESEYFSYYGSEEESESYFEPLRVLQNLQIAVGPATDQWGWWDILPFGITSPNVVVAAKDPKFGDCWTFKGSFGSLHINMRGLVQLRRMRLDHILPDPNYCAPRKFELVGITETGYRVNMVDDEYKLNGTPKQFFNIEASDEVTEVMFYINSNHGNPSYTCIYRIRFYISAKTESKGLLWYWWYYY